MVHLGPLVQDDPSSSNLPPTTSKSSSSSTTNNTTQEMIIPLEDPSTIPSDETTFLHGPHFTPTNPFHRSLSSLDLSFRCTICFELYNVPVSLYPCLHTFCSMCIRKNLRTQFCGMKRKAECPVCNTNLLTNGSSGGNWEKAILPNRDLESKVDLYREGVRGELRRSLVRLDVLERMERMRNSEQNGGNGNNDEQKQPAAMSSSKRARRSTANYKREYSSDHDDDDGNEVDADETMTASDSRNDGGRTAAASAVDASSVPPPPPPAAASINNHNIQQQQPQRKRKPTISYHNLKRKQLLTLCTTENLPTTGTDTELKHRHSEYILLYNSQCDSQHPMSEREVVATVMKEEKGRKREAVKNKTGSKKKVNGEMERKFQEMIESVKARKNGGGVSDSSSECKEGDGGVVPSCIAAAAAAVVANGSSGSNGNNASKPRAKSGNDVSVAASSTASAVASSGAPSMKAAAAASTSSRTTATTTQRKSITNNVHKQKATPSKSRTSKKQATISSAAKKKLCGIWKCQTCTFENHKYTTATALCEMCGTPRPEKENTSNEVISIDC